MERFCNNCGTLVEGDGKFCPSCGATLDSAVNLDKPAGAPSAEPMQSAPAMSANPYANNNQAQMPSYPQSYNNTSAPVNTTEMTVGQWVLTIFLSGLGIIGLVLLFVWGFSDSTPISKKNYARAMLIWQAIAIGLVILLYVGMFACAATCLGSTGGFEDIFRDIQYY